MFFNGEQLFKYLIQPASKFPTVMQCTLTNGRELENRQYIIK